VRFSVTLLAASLLALTAVASTRPAVVRAEDVTAFESREGGYT
jgi:hypothetical protein